MARTFQDARRSSACRWLVCAGLALVAAGATARGAETETRVYDVIVDGKQPPAGKASMVIQRLDDGTTHMTAETKVVVRVAFIKYTYTYSGHEVWKDGRLQQFSSRCDDNGKQYQVSAVAEGGGVRVQVNGQERMARPEIWLSSYWSLPDAKAREQVIPIIDADNGRDLQGRLQHVGTAQMSVAGVVQDVSHYHLAGTVQVDLWYDASNRLVRQEWIEDGHRTVLQLSGRH
jgi:hypothetical protein